MFDASWAFPIITLAHITELPDADRVNMQTNLLSLTDGSAVSTSDVTQAHYAYSLLTLR